MQRETVEILDNYGAGEIYENYSGRGMYGRTTWGLVFSDRPSLMATVAEVVSNLTDAGSHEEVGKFVKDISLARFDSLGLKQIIY